MATTHEGNLTNTPPFAYVKNQIDLRQELLGTPNLKNNPEILDVYNNRGVFARICSSISLDSQFSIDLQTRIDEILDIDPSERTARQNNDLKTFELNLTSTASERLKLSGFDSGFVDGLKGREFSKNFLIQGTVIKNPFNTDNSNQILEGGLGSFSNPFQGTYGWGSLTSDEEGFGYAPSPGITSANVKYLNKGAVTEVSINVKLYNRRQFQLFDLLYLRPGFSLLFEFGWTKYIKSGLNPFEHIASPTSVTGNETSGFSQRTEIQHARFNTAPFKEFFKDTPDKEAIFDSIEFERIKTEGNYDAVFGIISNFDWTFNEDGTYDCTIKMFGHGGVIEGLVANQQSGDKVRVANQTRYTEVETTDETTGETTTIREAESVPFNVPDANKSALGADLYRIIREYDFIENWPASNYDGFKFRRYYLEGFKDRNGQECNLYFENGLLGVSLESQTGHSSYGEEGDSFVQNPISYMLLGAFLALLQSKFLLYSFKEDSNQNPNPITSFDFNFVKKDVDGNILTKDEEGNDLFITGDGKDGGKNGVTYLPDNLKNDENYMLTAPGIFSADPGVCLVNWTNVTNEIAEITDNRDIKDGGIDVGGGITAGDVLGGLTKKNGKYYKDDMNARSFPAFNSYFVKMEEDQNGRKVPVQIQLGEEVKTNDIRSVPRDAFLGKIANIYVNINMLTKLAGQSGDGQNLFMNSFLQNLLMEIQGAFGGINQLRAETRETGVITIRDLIPSIKPNSVEIKDKKPIVNVFGINKNNNLGSFVKKFNINGSIPKDMMTQIIIGATATGNSITSNSTGLAGYNRGLTDIFKPNVKSGLESVVSEDDTLAGIFENKVAQPFIDVYNKRIFTSENLNKLKEGSKTFFPLLLGAYSNRNLVTSTFLPFDMSLEVDGISGFTVFNAVRVNDDILPVSYKNQGTSLMLSGMDQQIDESGWKTSLSCITFSDPAIVVGTGFKTTGLSEDDIVDWYLLTIEQLPAKLDEYFDVSDACKGKQYTGLEITGTDGFDVDQKRNAKAIYDVCKSLGITNTYLMAGLMVTAWGECSLRFRRESTIYYQNSFRLNYGTEWRTTGEHSYPNYKMFGYVWGPDGYLAEKLGSGWSPEVSKEYFDRFIKRLRELHSEGENGWRKADIYWSNYVYSVNKDLDFPGPSLDFTTHQSEEYLLNPESPGFKYRGGGGLQLTGPGKYEKAGKLLFDAGMITDKNVFVRHPDLLNDEAEPGDDFVRGQKGRIFTDTSLAGVDPAIFKGNSMVDIRNQSVVLSILRNIVGDLGGKIKNGEIAGGTDTRETVLNRLNCITDRWVGTYIATWANTGGGDPPTEKRRVNDGKNEKWYEEDGLDFRFTKNNTITLS